MCHTNTPPPPPSSSDLTNKDSRSRLPTPHRKNRTKTRKPKFLSLRLQLSSDQSSNPMTHHHQQLNLFPLHPENLIHDKDIMHEDHNVAFLFTSHDTATLNGLLQHDSPTTTATNTTVSEEDSMSPPCVTADDGRSLVRKAMKRRNEESDEREERWVCYSEVTSYCSAGTAESAAATTATIGLLSLKLDHEGILNAWSDKGPLFLPGDSDSITTPHGVPDFFDHLLPHHHPPHVIILFLLIFLFYKNCLCCSKILCLPVLL